MRRSRLITTMFGALAVLAASIVPAVAAGEATYTVTITNLTDGQALTPPLVVTHRPSVELFEVGEPASEGLQEIAENGNLGPAVAWATESRDSRHVLDAVVALPTGDGPPPILAGASRSFEVTASNGATLLSWASMLICTNDGFTGVDAVRLPKQVGDSLTVATGAYDAGTEINTEDLADIVPPCQALSGVPDDEGAPGTGTSDPALAEGGVVAPHAGIGGGSDLVPAIHGWDDPVAAITITRDS